jgi:chromosome segregation ATPase
MEKIIEELNSLQKQIQDSKTKKAQLEGRREEQMNRLKEFGVKTIEEGNKKLEKIIKELGKLETEIQEKFKTLKENFEW